MFGYGFLLVTILMYGLLYYEFDQASKLTTSLEKEGYIKTGKGQVTFIDDGLLYYFSKSKPKHLATYRKVFDNTIADVSISIAASRSSKGSSTFIPSLSVSIKLSGRKDLFHFIDDYQCSSGTTQSRNRKYNDLKSFFGEAELSNGIPISPCYSENVVKVLDSLKFSSKFSVLPTNVWYPQNGRVDTKVSLSGYSGFTGKLGPLVVVYKALTK